MLDIFLAAFVTFFVVIDPPGVVPMFATMTAHMSPEWRQRMAVKSVVLATFILCAFAFGGAWLLAKLSVSLDSFRIAGGVLLFLIAVDMLFEKRTERRETRAEAVIARQAEHPEREDDISVFPLAIPLIAGPGAIASVMLFFTQHDDWGARSAVISAAGANLVLCLGGFLLSGPLTRLMGVTFAAMLTRVFGILLAALAAQFIVDGVRNAFGV